MVSKATKDILDLGIMFAEQYKKMGLIWTTDDLATDIVAMLPSDFAANSEDIIGACIALTTNYPQIKTADLIDAITSKLNARSPLKPRALSSLFLLGGLFLGWVLFKKR